MLFLVSCIDWSLISSPSCVFNNDSLFLPSKNYGEVANFLNGLIFILG